MDKFTIVRKKERRNDIRIDKQMLCFNILTKGVCNYKNRCLFAHSLQEQKLKEIRKEAYNIIFGKSDLSNLDLTKNINLYEELKILTNVCLGCLGCSDKPCQGGMNCKYGVCRKEWKLCYDDLVYGTCYRENCGGIHLTKRGYIPYTVIQNKKIKQQHECTKIIKDLCKSGKKIDEDFFEEDLRNCSIFNL